MITKFVLIAWFAGVKNGGLSIQTFDTQAECEAVASVVENEMASYRVRFQSYRCVPYTF